MPDVKQNVETLRAEAEACGVPFVVISTFTGEGKRTGFNDGKVCIGPRFEGLAVFGSI